MNIKWDTKKYTSNFSFVPNYGNDVLNLIEAQPGAKVLDLGCGNGALSKVLSDKGYKVIGLDASEDFIKLAQKTYPEIPFILGNATNFNLKEAIDVIFSNAVLHWIDKDNQEDLIKSVYRNLKPGGEFVFECGGYGCHKLTHQVIKEVFEKHNYSYLFPFYFPTISEYSTLVEKNGFLVKFAVLFDRPTELVGETGINDWIHMFVKKPFEVIEDLNEREQIIKEAVEKLRPDLYRDNTWISDYVRLRMRAIKI